MSLNTIKCVGKAVIKCGDFVNGIGIPANLLLNKCCPIMPFLMVSRNQNPAYYGMSRHAMDYYC